MAKFIPGKCCVRVLRFCCTFLPPPPPPHPTRGSGEFQHLGHGEEEHVKVPKLVARLSGEKIVKLSVGSHHILALAESGNLYGWGKNTDGEVDGSGENIPLPKLLPNASKQGVMYIACGLHEVSYKYHTLTG